MNINEAMEFINSFTKSGKPITDLSRARGLVERIGNPAKRLKFVHIAGTNGKGSTVEYISNALIYSGYRTGQFTSPFVLHYTDRIRINGEDIDEKSLCELAERVRECTVGGDYSQFEITMAIAMLWFEREGCDIVVLEAGIGGLLDCTNVIPPPILSVITSISLDHTAILGDTVEKIATQKAGIIKGGSAVVTDFMNPRSVVKIIKETAKSCGADFIKAKNSDFKALAAQSDGQPFIYRGEHYKTAMFGNAQPVNAVTAIEACRYIRTKGFNISDENIMRSIGSSQIKARCQFIDGKPPVLVDGGHNPGGIENLTGVLRRFCVKDKKKLYTVMGMVDTKDYEAGVYEAARYCGKMFTVDGFAPNAVNARKLAEIAAELHECEPCDSLEAAVEKAVACALESGGMVVVCGSLYLASEYLNKYQSAQK